MRQQTRHILLLCNNASSHSHNDAAHSNIKVAYLVPDSTAWILLMDAGIIRTFKANYRWLLSQHALDLNGQGVDNPYNVTQLDRMCLARQSWDALKPATIQNC